MPTNTDLSVSPYFDDYQENSDYYKILFRPGVAVQTRELNQLQTLLQRQIERFGDNIFKRGTIVDGCDITFHDSYPFAKIRDSQTDGAPVNVNQFVGYYIKNEANVLPLVAAIQTVVDGYESRSPDLKTLYLRYVSTGYANIAGVNTEQSTFAANQTLTVYDPDSPIESIVSYNDSAGFSNNDTVVISSALAIQNSTGGTAFANNFYAGDHVNDGTANVQILSVDTTSNSEVVILRVKPRAVDLKAANSALWSIAANSSVRTTNVAPSDIATVVDFVGSGAAALLRTGSQGDVNSITITSGGSGYYVLPTVSISSTGATTTQITTANLVPQTYLTKVTVANDSVFSIGAGYAMSVGSGVIYQKGYFSRVNEHLVIVDKYSTQPDSVAVGFDTTEYIINSNQDQTLLDNATGQPNETAPGANRLKLTPTLIVKTKAEADANTDFLSIAEFSGGNPYKQNKQTVYNVIGNEMARRTFEESGNYVVDQFILNTKTANTLGGEASSFKVQIDPGVAYVNGKRIETVLNYEVDVDKGTDTFVSTNANISLNYGNYVRVKELSGIFKFNLGDVVTLYPTAAQYYTAGGVGATPSAGALGTSLGTARIRSLVLESGTPGTADCTYRLYLFDIRVATAKNVSLIRSIFYDGTNKGVGDVVLENGVAVIKDNNLSGLLYSAGKPAVKTGNSYSYIYRTINDSGDIKLATNGLITISATGGDVFPYTAGATLSTSQESDIIVTPLANVEASANIAGSVTCNATSAQVNGTSTSFTSTLQSGDFIKIANSTVSIVRQVARVANDTVLTLTTNASAFTAANSNIFFPAGAPISLNRSTRSVNVNSTSNTLNISLDVTTTLEANVAVAYNVRAANVTPVVKTVNRDRYVRLRLANNSATSTGPWALGIPDVFRLDGVFLGANATFTAAEGTDITSDFYIDHNQNENYYGISYLYKRPESTRTLTSGDFLLVKMDHFTSSGEGLKSPGASGTYSINDTVTLAASASSINTLEIPEVYSAKGDYYDLRDQFDFRPLSANTVATSSTEAGAPINPTEPSNTARFAATDKRFPAPDSTLTGTIEYYLGRADRVIIDENNTFHIVKGSPGSNVPPAGPNNALTVNVLNIPPYPSHPYRLSADVVEFVDNRIANEKYTGARLKNYRIDTPINSDSRKALQPRGYSMQDIGKLEKRIQSLEYYVSYTLVEALVQKKSIPSSANSALERAKFGFFVDSFDNYNLSDTGIPGYSATIVDGFLSPRVKELNFPLTSVVQTEKITLPYNEKVFVSQSQATDGPLVVSSNTSTGNTGVDPSDGTVVIEPGTPSSNTSSNTVSQIITSIVQIQRTTAYSDTGSVYDEYYNTLSATTGPVEFYISARDNNIALEVFQSTSEGGPWTSTVTSATAAAITGTDIAIKNLSTLTTYGKIEHPGALNRKSYGPVGHFIEDQFKLLWTHNPTNGIYYKIRVYKGKNHGGQGKKGKFKFKMFYPIDTLELSTYAANGFTPTTGYNLGYSGTFIGLDSNTMKLALSQFNLWGLNPTSDVIQPVYDNSSVAGEQVFSLITTGLKANTAHTFYFEGVNVTSKCKQEGKALGAGLVSDANGKIRFDFFYYPDIVSTSTVSADAASIEQTANVKAIKLVSNDGTSTATTTIQIQGYVKENINTAPESFAVSDTVEIAPTNKSLYNEWNVDRL